MIFAYSTDDQTLTAFRTESEAVAYAEGIDVEDGVWRFFGSDGVELVPQFQRPNERGLVTVQSGLYSLVRSTEPQFSLRDLVHEIRAYDGAVSSLADVLRILEHERTA